MYLEPESGELGTGLWRPDNRDGDPGSAPPPLDNHSDQENAQNNQPQPTLDQRYVTFPGHPFYGQQFIVLSRRVSKTYTRCVIENPLQPGFHYHISERWLSTLPPSPLAKPSLVIALEIHALDRMTQLFLTITKEGTSPTNGRPDTREGAPDLGANSDPEPTTAPPSVIQSGIQTNRRNQ